MKHRSTRIVLLFLLTVLLVPTLPSAAAPPRPGKKDDLATTQAANAQTANLSAISIAGTPLQINVYADGSVGLLENGVVQFYRERASGVFLWAGGQTWGPTVPAGNPLTNLTLVDHGTLRGDGTPTNPYRVASQFRVGDTGLLVTQTITYINGDRAIAFEWNIINTGAAQPVTLFHAADLFVQGNDDGGGYFDLNTQTVGGVNLQSRHYGLFTPITPASAYEEGGYGTIWSRISERGQGFVDRIVEDEIDNGAGLQWNIPELAAGTSISIQDTFSVTPVPGGGDNPANEQPPLSFEGQTMPALREFEFGFQFSERHNTYSSDDLRFNIPISRYYGGKIAPMAHLTLRAFDVDGQAEENIVRVGDCTVGRLSGRHNAWQDVTLSFPSTCLKFPDTAIRFRDDVYDKEPIPEDAQLMLALNPVVIDVDAGNQGYKTTVAWVKLYVGGARPVLFSHGLDLFCDNGRFRELGDWKDFLQADGIPGLGNRNDGSRPTGTQARQMEETYAEMQRLFGLRTKGDGVAETDKIIIVGHSMGGLTGRRFIHEVGSDVVADFVTFGTPNLGALTANTPVPCSKPARDNLKSEYVESTFNPTYNLANTWSPSTANHMASIAARGPSYGIGDGAVSNASTHGLPYDRHLFYTFDTDSYSYEEFTELTLHTQIPLLQSMYDKIKREGRIGQVIDAGAGEAHGDAALAQAPQPATVTPAAEQPNLVPIRSVAFKLDPGQSSTTAFPVDTLAQLSTLLDASDSANVRYELRAPSGTVYTPTMGEIIVERPEVGTWSAVVTASATASQPIQVVFAATAVSDLDLVETARPFYVRIGETGTFGITLHDGETPLTGAALTGTLTSPNGTFSIVTLSEINPGVYNVNYQAALSGTYTLDVVATGTRRDGTAFRREASLVATSILGGVIDPERMDVRWNTADTNGDALTDVLSATFAVDVPQAGTYTLAGSLGTAAQPSQFGASHTVDLAAGSNTVTLEFERENFGHLLTADTYFLQQVRVSRNEDEVVDWREQFTNGFLVEPSAFQQPLLRGMVNTATPNDENGDGRYDELVFTSVITATRAGDYKLQATLADSTNQPFTFAEQGLALVEGENTIQIPFSGEAIAANGVSGPFTLADVVVKPLDPALNDQQLRLINSFRTPPLNVADFAQPVQLSISTNMDPALGYVQSTPASATGLYPQGTNVELRPVFYAASPERWTWSLDNGSESATPTLNVVMDTNHHVRLTISPVATPTATNTPVPPTATATLTPIPPTATATVTRTPVPPTATATRTPIPPTATATQTPVPATATATPTLTATPPVSTPIPGLPATCKVFDSVPYASSHYLYRLALEYERHDVYVTRGSVYLYPDKYNLNTRVDIGVNTWYTLPARSWTNFGHYEFSNNRAQRNEPFTLTVCPPGTRQRQWVPLVMGPDPAPTSPPAPYPAP